MPPVYRLAAVSLLLATAPALAQSSDRPREGWTAAGSVRLRYEAIDGQARAGFNSSDALLNVRTILSAEYQGDGARIGAELYDSRAYGASLGTPLSTGEVNALELVQAYVGARFGLGSNAHVDLQAGRFLLNIGSRRLVAADDYRNTTNGYTGLRADVAVPGGVRATLIYVLPQSRRPDDFQSLLDNRMARDRESFDLVLWGGTVAKTRAFGKVAAETSFYHLGERDTPGRPTRNRSLNTYGGRIFRDAAAGSLDYEVEGFHQSGTVRTGQGAAAAIQRVSAWFVHGDVGYTFGSAWKPRVSIEYDRSSGDGAGGRYGRFDTLFGMRRADLAPSGLYNAVGRANISSPGVRVEGGDKRSDGLITYRAMWLASDEDSFSTTGVRDVRGRAGDFAGHQFDARLRHWLMPDRLRLELDGVVLLKGRFLRTAPNAPPVRATRYVSVNVTASF